MEVLYIKFGLLFVLFFSEAPIFCGEDLQEDQDLQQEYTDLRQELINSLTPLYNNLKTARRQFTSDQTFDNAITMQLLDQILANLPQNTRNIVRPIFMILHSPTSWILHVQYVLNFLHKHPYDETHGAYLMEILDRYVNLATNSTALLENYSQNIQTTAPNQIQGLTIVYMIGINRLKREITELLNDMALID